MRFGIVTVQTTALGDRSYLVHDGESALVVDPQRDIDRLEAVLAELGLRLSHVFETHLHNDYVTGGLALAERHGAAYVVPGGDAVSFERVPVADGQQFTIGQLSVVAHHTPGHTPNHMAYEVRHEGRPVAVLTGGSMLFGAVGRTDLISPERTEELTRAQYRSVRRLAELLPGDVSVYPTHGFGSFCSATETSGDESTIDNERRQNLALTVGTEDAFVEQLLDGLTAYPSYYAHMGALNAAGPAAPDLSPPERVDRDVLRERLAKGEWIIDLRQRRAYAAAHIGGTVCIELGDGFATYFGWTIPWGSEVTLVAENPEQVAEARRQLVRIGVDELAGAAVGPIEEVAGGVTASYEVTDFAGLAAAYGEEGQVILDVRRPDEWAAGRVAGALHIPFFELAERLGEIPPGKVYVYCASGLRSTIASSMLDRAGRRCVLVDDQWEQARNAGLPIESASGAD